MAKGFQIPMQELLAPHREDSTDFASLPWCQAIISDPDFTRITMRPVLAERPLSRSLFAKTLWTPDTIRSCLCFYTKSIIHQANSPNFSQNLTPTSFGETRMLLSLGTGINGIAGILHGGLIGFLLDEVTGVPVCVQAKGYFVTAEMRISYLKPVETPRVILCRSWVEQEGNEKFHEGRKIRVMGTVEDGMGGVLARGESLFVRLKEKL